MNTQEATLTKPTSRKNSKEPQDGQTLRLSPEKEVPHN